MKSVGVKISGNARLRVGGSIHVSGASAVGLEATGGHVIVMGDIVAGGQESQDESIKAIDIAHVSGDGIVEIHGNVIHNGPKLFDRKEVKGPIVISSQESNPLKKRLENGIDGLRMT